MNQIQIDQILTNADTKRKQNVQKATSMIQSVLTAYHDLHPQDEQITDHIFLEEQQNIHNIETLFHQEKWYENPDIISSIFHILPFCVTTKRLIKHADPKSPFYQTDFSRVQRQINPENYQNLRQKYEQDYLDSPKMNYDGDIFLCDPNILLTDEEQKMCPSLYKHDTLNPDRNYHIPVKHKNSLIGYIYMQTGQLCTVLGKDIFAINSARDIILYRTKQYSYTFIRQFHGTIQYTIKPVNDKYCVCITGIGNHPFTVKTI